MLEDRETTGTSICSNSHLGVSTEEDHKHIKKDKSAAETDFELGKEGKPTYPY